jgi:cysteine-rich repeat protein
MSARRIGRCLSCLAAAAAATGPAACGHGDDERPARQPEQDGSGGANAAGGGQSHGDGVPGEAGGSGEPKTDSAGESAGGAAGDETGPPAECGNAVAEGDEQCDAESFAPGVTCRAFGFDDGTLGCRDDCTANTDDCYGTESCYDGRDNDGDGEIDCLDSEDCAGACSDPCAAVPVLDDPASVSGWLSGSADLMTASCSGADSGPELVYELVAATTGLLEIELTSSEQLTVSVRSACDSVASELGCSVGRLSLPVTEGERLYLVVEGFSETDAGGFSLQAASRPENACGDEHLDAAEQCEDGNTSPGDGCDSNCQLESTETEPNDSIDAADAFSDPFYASISPEGDQDCTAIIVDQGPASLRLNTYNVGLGMCELQMMDSHLELLDPEGALVAEDDNGGDGMCARLSYFGLPAGTYYVLVKASDAAAPEMTTFPYRLGVSLDACGNGAVAAGEQCDDGNTTNGDGCSSLCRLEPGF